MSNNPIWLIDKTLSGAITPGQSEPGRDDNEGVLCTPWSSSIIGASLSACLVSYPGHLLWGELLPLCRDEVGVFYSPTSRSDILEKYLLFIQSLRPKIDF